MPRTEVGHPWYASPYTGLFASSGPVPALPHDPAVCAWAGLLPRWGEAGADLAVGGVGWTPAAAEAAGVGEAVERWRCRPELTDDFVEASCDDWPLKETPVRPERWVLFHPDQYASAGFPFRPFTPSSRCRWYACRELLPEDGAVCWAPGWQVFLEPGAVGGFGPSISTGLASGRAGHPVLLRGLQEVLERDALVGAWWGCYPLEEHDLKEVLSLLPPSRATRLQRPGLRYRCYRIATPFSSHVTVVTAEGDDLPGWVFSAGSACRETRAASWEKSFLEAVQGRHYVRHLLEIRYPLQGLPVDFAGHALYYSLHPDALARTVLQRPWQARRDDGLAEEKLPALLEGLAGYQVLFRLVTPSALANLGWVVARVLVPGLQPLHGHHALPFLGGPFWQGRRLADWAEVLPHPFP